jgi:outer membrane receptor protein involved in Fe transport
LIQFQQDAYGRARALNLGRARILGVEASLTGTFTRYARLRIDGTFTDARDVSDSSLGAHTPLLPNRPRFHLYARPEARLPLRRGLLLGAYLDGDFVDGNHLDPANLVALPPRILVGAGVFVEAPRARLTVVASAQNLGDTRTFDFAGFPLPSRSFFVTARVRFDQEAP